MKFRIQHLAATLGLLASMSGTAWAQANPASPAGWSAYGDVVSSGSRITLTTAFLDDDADQSHNLSGHSAIDVFFDNMAGKASVDITAFDIGGQFAYEGSLITKSFNAVAGQTLSFDWSFTTFETTYLDNAFVIVDSSLVSLATTAQPGAASQSFSYTFAQSGAATLALGVVDTDSVAGVSVLSFGNLQLSAVTAPIPEPSTWALLAGGLGIVGWCSRRRQRAAA